MILLKLRSCLGGDKKAGQENTIWLLGPVEKLRLRHGACLFDDCSDQIIYISNPEQSIRNPESDTMQITR